MLRIDGARLVRANRDTISFSRPLSVCFAANLWGFGGTISFLHSLRPRRKKVINTSTMRSGDLLFAANLSIGVWLHHFLLALPSTLIGPTQEGYQHINIEER